VTSLTLQWTAVGDDGSEGEASGYDIRYSEFPITEANFESLRPLWSDRVMNGYAGSSLPTPLPAGAEERFELGCLKANTTHYVAMKAGDELHNFSPLSNVISGSTLLDEDPPRIVPGSISAELDTVWGDNLLPGFPILIVSWAQTDLPGNAGGVGFVDYRTPSGSVETVSEMPYQVERDEFGCLIEARYRVIIFVGAIETHRFRIRGRDLSGNERPTAEYTLLDNGNLGVILSPEILWRTNRDLCQNYPSLCFDR
jgi:hypothetical protein